MISIFGVWRSTRVCTKVHKKNSLTEPTKISSALSNAQNSAGSYSINLKIQRITQASTKKQSESQTTPENTPKNAEMWKTAFEREED